MNRATPRLRSVAERLMVAESNQRRDSPSSPPAADFPITDRLRPHLATLVGNGGVRALLARSLSLAAAEVAWLRQVRIDENGDLEGLQVLRAELDPAMLHEGRVVLLAQLLGLLAAFIGPGLTSRLMGEVWPQVPLNDGDFGKEGDREKAG